MILAGNCLYIDDSFGKEVWDTAIGLRSADIFRCKIWGGGTTNEKYFSGIGEKGLKLLKKINDHILPVATEIQIPEHLDICRNNIDHIWIGARNSQNYALLEKAAKWPGRVFVKRGFGMTMDELIGIYDIMVKRHNKKIYVVERGINTFDRTPDLRWGLDFRGVVYLKKERPDIFDNLLLDASHGSGYFAYIEDTYEAFKHLGVKHFMFEVYANVKEAVTDKYQGISVDYFEKIVGEKEDDTIS